MEEKSLFQPPTEDERKCPSTHWETKRSIKPFYTGGALALHPMRTSHLISLCNGALQQCDLDSGEVTLYVEKVRKFNSSGKRGIFELRARPNEPGLGGHLQLQPFSAKMGS